MEKKNKKSKQLVIMILISIITISIINFFNSDLFKAENISYKQFEKLVDNEEIKKIMFNSNNDLMIIIDKDGNSYKTTNPEYETFKKEHLSKGIEFQLINLPSVKSGMNYILMGVLIIMGVMTISSFSKGPGQIMANTPKKLEDGKIPKVKFDDISGLEDVKADLKLAVQYLKNPQEFTAIGAKMPTGIVFYGSPGTGKTMLAKAIAGEAGVPFFQKSGSEFVEMFAGMGAKKIRDLFAEARKNAPCIVFIDEIDAVGKKRSSNLSGNDEREQTLNELLNQLDGFENNEGILVISATNRLEILDEALIRPGRFGKHVKIPLPKNAKERLKILKIHASNKCIDEKTLEHVSEITRGFSGADLENLLNETALLQKLNEKDSIDLDLIDKAFFKIATKGSKIPSKERALLDNKIVAWHEAGHTLASKLYKQEFYQVTISGSTSGVGGATFTGMEESRALKTIKDLKDNIKTLYAGRIAESFILGDNITVGASNDIKVASEIIREMVSEYGMSTSNHMLNFEVVEDSKLIIRESSKLSKDLYDEAFKDIEKNKDALEEIALALIKNETLYEVDVDNILIKYKNFENLIDMDKHKATNKSE